MLQSRVEGPTANECWLTLLDHVLGNSKTVAPRGQGCMEVINMSTCFPMRKPIVTNPTRKLGYKFLFAEAWWILTGRDDVDSIAPFSKSIGSFSDDGYTFYGAYGPRILAQLTGVVARLYEDKDTRQAVLTIWRRNPPKSKDIPCTVSIQFLIRNNQLHCIDTMRSSDIWLGWPYDVFNFTMLSSLVLLELRNRYVALELGNLYMNLGSAHLYARNFKDAAACLETRDQHKFRYPHLVPAEEFRSPVELINHLYWISHGEYSKLRSKWVHCVGRGDHDKNKQEVQDAVKVN